MKKIFFICFIALMPFFTLAQKQYVDSLMYSLQTASADTIKLQLFKKLRDHYVETNYDSSLLYGYEILGIAERLGLPSEKINALNAIGYSLTTAANFNAALDMFLQAKMLAEKEQGQEEYLAESYHLIGNLYHGQKNYKDAINYFKKAWEINSKLNRDIGDYTSLMNLGAVYLKENQLDSALYYSQRAYERALSKKDKTYFPHVLRILGDVHEKLGSKEIALSYYRQSHQELRLQSSPTRPTSALYITLSKYYKKEGSKDSALYYAYAAVRSIEGTTFKSSLLNAYLNISELYSSNGDSAYKYLKIATEIKDSIFSTQKVQQFQSQRYQESIREQQLEEKLTQEKVDRKRNLQYAAIALGLVSFIILFFLLSHSTIANQKLISFLGILALLIVFEFLNLFLHPFLDRITNHQPVLMLAAMVCIAALLIPLHHKLEHWITHKMVEKNKKIRLAAAKKTIATLEGNAL